MRFILDILILSTLGCWLVLSVVNHFPRWKDVLTRHDSFSLLPAWSFFAPQPGTSDFHWLFRDMLEDGTITPWTELTLVEERSITSVLFNPHKRSLKTLLDIAGELSSPSLNQHGSKAVALSLGYLLLLNHLNSIQHSAASIQTQFMLMTSSGARPSDQPSVYFLSHFHILDTAMVSS